MQDWFVAAELTDSLGSSLNEVAQSAGLELKLVHMARRLLAGTRAYVELAVDRAADDRSFLTAAAGAAGVERCRVHWREGVPTAGSRATRRAAPNLRAAAEQFEHAVARLTTSRGDGALRDGGGAGGGTRVAGAARRPAAPGRGRAGVAAGGGARRVGPDHAIDGGLSVEWQRVWRRAAGRVRPRPHCPGRGGRGFNDVLATTDDRAGGRRSSSPAAGLRRRSCSSIRARRPGVPSGSAGRLRRSTRWSPPPSSGSQHERGARTVLGGRGVSCGQEPVSLGHQPLVGQRVGLEQRAHRRPEGPRVAAARGAPARLVPVQPEMLDRGPVVGAGHEQLQERPALDRRRVGDKLRRAGIVPVRRPGARQRDRACPGRAATARSRRECDGSTNQAVL